MSGTDMSAIDMPLGNPPPLPNVWVWGLYGGKGQGKTAAAVHLAYKAWRHMGRRVLYWPSQLELNFHQTIRPEFRHLFPPVEPITLLEIARLDDRLNNAFVIFDEVHMVLPSTRASAMASSQIVGFLTQIRKRGSWLIWCTNSPRAVNQLLLDQTDIHGKCVGGKWIKKSNMMFIRLKDTQGRWSKGDDGYMGRMDVRRKMAKKIHNISFTFRLYNTNAIADPAEVWALSKEVVLGRREEELTEKEFGLDQAALRVLVEQAVVWVVKNEGATVLSASGCARIIMEHTGTERPGKGLPIAQLGRIMGELGLPIKSRAGTGNYRILPPIDMLDLWLAGRYVPSEEDHLPPGPPA
jgi:hypothetical protein